MGIERPSNTLERTDLTVQAGEDPLDTFRVVRIRATDGCRQSGAPPVMMAAPYGFPPEFWEISSGDYEDGFGPRLAAEGYEVWLLGSRLGPEAGACESGAVDCSAMAGWDQETAVSDALFVRFLVARGRPPKEPVMVGMSAGASTAISTVNADPGAFAGLMIWEGSMYTDDPALRARNADFCAVDEQLLASGQYFDPTLGLLKGLVNLAAVAPNDPSTVPGFPPGLTNLQAMLLVFTQPNPASPLSFQPDFIRAAGDPIAGTLEAASFDRLFALGPLVSSYGSIAQQRDAHCALGGGISRFTDRLDTFEGDVLVYAAGRGFGDMATDTASLMTAADVTVVGQPSFGELDFFLHDDWQSVALAPMLDWLEGVF